MHKCGGGDCVTVWGLFASENSRSGGGHFVTVWGQFASENSRSVGGGYSTTGWRQFDSETRINLGGTLSCNRGNFTQFCVHNVQGRVFVMQQGQFVMERHLCGSRLSTCDRGTCTRM